MQILGRLQKQTRARHLSELRAHALHHLVRRELALRQRLQRDEHIGLIEGAAADEADHRGNGRILLDDVLQLRELFLHLLEGNALVRDDLAQQQPVVLLREERGGHQLEKKNIEHDQADQRQAHQQRVIEHLGERTRIGAFEAFELRIGPDRPARL